MNAIVCWDYKINDHENLVKLDIVKNLCNNEGLRFGETTAFRALSTN